MEVEMARIKTPALEAMRKNARSKGMTGRGFMSSIGSTLKAKGVGAGPAKTSGGAKKGRPVPPKKTRPARPAR